MTMLSSTKLISKGMNGTLTISVVFEAFRNSFSQIALLANLLFQEITNGDASPVEVLSQGKSVFFAVRTWGATDENSSRYKGYINCINSYAQVSEAFVS